MSSSEVVLVMDLFLLPRLFALVANFDGQCMEYAALFPIFALVVNFDAQWM